MKTVLQSQIRVEAIRVIQQVIADNVFGHVFLLPMDDIHELRQKLREAYPFEKTTGWPYKVWCEEIREALGYPVKVRRRKVWELVKPSKKWSKPPLTIQSTPYSGNERTLFDWYQQN
ncbi:MAG: hypothetical protein QM680_01045 [Luteolibacter sp.]